MSTTSLTTASVVRDWVPFDEANLQVLMCVLVLMKRDGTPFDVTSVLEEGIIEICIKMGHTYPMGVFHYSVTESIILFWSADNMQCATCRAIKMIVLHGEANAVRASAPSENHVRAYMATVGWEPTRTHPPPSEGEGEPHLAAGNPHPGGGTLHHLQADLGDLANDELHQLMEDLCWEVTLYELNAPPEAPNHTLGKPSRKWGSQSRWPGGNLSERWSVGSPGTIPTTCPCTARWGGWIPPGQHPQLPLSLAHLINTLVSGLCLGAPWINTFSGEAMPGKTEVSFKQWYHRIQCIKDYYPDAVVWESIGRSLKGAAADMVRYIGPIASVSNILQKLTVIFGMVASFDILMQNFYKVTHENHKKVPFFTTRLEGTLNQIWIKCPGQKANCEVLWHLKDCLFHGFENTEKIHIRYLYSNPTTTYSKLMVAAYKVECEPEEA